MKGVCRGVGGLANRVTSDNEGWKLVSFDLVCFRWFWRNEVKCYVSVQVTYLLDFKICLITFKALKFNQSSYVRELLSFSSHESTLGLRSADDPYRLHEPRAIGERGFANRSFSCIAPRLYNKFPITIKLIDSLNNFKSHLKAFLFSRVYNQSGLTVQEDYAL